MEESRARKRGNIFKMANRTTINIDKEVKMALKGCKRYRRETYDDILKRLIKEKVKIK